MKLILSLVFLGGTVLAQSQGNIWDQLSRCETTCSSRCLKLASDLREQLDRVDSSCSASQPVDQKLFQEIYEYAKSSSGMWLNPDEARAFAEKMIEKTNTKSRFPIFKEAYVYAKSSSGLWLNPEPAREFAMKIFKHRNSEQALKCYKEAYTYAKSSSGLWLNPDPAREHAEKVCKI